MGCTVVALLVGELVRLVVLEQKHLDDILRGWNNPELRRFLGGMIPMGREEETEWLRSAIEGMKARREFDYVIERSSDGAFLGGASLHGINWISGSCTLGIAIHSPENWGKGYGSEAMRLLVDYAWNSLNLRRIELTVHAFNKRAIRTYQKVGFKEFGVAHKRIYIEGQYYDTIFMELFREASQRDA
ncbi:MAG: hypothetical protein C4K49_01290 [Candidatus Thorarchaeota archaeon]|nr:MAG: hypothetical protein C4K49_01290 [Candidatus Thorarchaeota archaeon]